MAEPNRITSVYTVEFNGSIDRENELKWELDDERQSDRSFDYIRLYPRQPTSVFTTSGSIAYRGADFKDVEEYINFSVSNFQALEYPNAEEVQIVRITPSYDANGNRVNSTVYYNKSRQGLESSVPIYGAYKVTYKAPYRLYALYFSGTPCNPNNSESGYKQATVVAIDADLGISASITVTPPECGGSISSGSRGKDAEIPRIILEIHKDYPPALTAIGGNDNPLKASCRIRMIPPVNASLSLSNGIEPSPVSGVKTEVVKDAISFSGSVSANFKYQPGNEPDIQSTGSFIDIWGNVVSSRFALAGDTITEVTWLSDSTYEDERTRTVRNGEIVFINSSYVAIPVYGSVVATYVLKYKEFVIDFSFIDPLQPLEGWTTIHAVANYNGQIGYLKIDPPTLRFT